jgi:pyridoxal phosphate enzyme (YggS family)
LTDPIPSTAADHSSLSHASELTRRIRETEDRIRETCVRAGRDPSAITLCAVTKTVPADRIREAVDAGIRVFGENRVQEASQKIAELSDLRREHRIEWNFIGHLQANKARRACELFDAIQSIDSIGLAERLDRIAGEKDRILKCLLEVNIDDEATKSGVSPDQVLLVAKSIARLAHLDLCGLMTVAPYLEPVERVRPYFSRLRELRDRARDQGIELHDLSMGMSHDFQTAIEEGATIVRIGTAIFGPRDRM